MEQGEFFKALGNLDDEFFIWNGLLRTRVRTNVQSVDPITAVARSQGYKGSDLSEAVKFLELDLSFAVLITEIADGAGVYTPTDLKIKAKVMNRTVKRKLI